MIYHIILDHSIVCYMILDGGRRDLPGQQGAGRLRAPGAAAAQTGGWLKIALVTLSSLRLYLTSFEYFDI